MAFDIKDVLLDTRKSGITIDYVKSSRDALECLDHVQPKDIEDVNNDSIYQDWSKHEPLKISREALTYLSTLCCNSTPLKSSLIMTFGQSANLELPLLTTNHEDDLIDFKKAIATTKIRYMERPEGLDLSAIDKDLAGFDLEAQISMRKGYQVDKEGFKIGREALKYLQNLIGSKKPYNSGDEIIYHQTPDLIHLSSPLISHERLTLPPITSIHSLRTQEVIDIEIETSESSIAPWSHENILLPEGTRETPLDVDNLQIVLARCSMTPDIGDRKSRARRSMKVGSPLTPPNTVRLHRKFAATDPKTLFQELGVIPPTRISSSSIKSFTQQDNAGFENARAAVEKRISTERIQPRLVARKICLPHVGPTWPFSNQPIDWGHENIRQFRSNIEKDIRNTRLVDPDGRKMSWAPWSPFTFVPDHFWARFVTLIPETIPQFEVIPKPLDPRTLVHLSEDEDDIEDLRPADFSHIDELSVLVRKRRGENIRHQNDKLAKDSFNKIDDASGVMENPFSDLGFRLLVNKKTKFEKLGHRKHLSKGAERVLKPVLPQEEVQIGLGSLKSVPNIAPHPVVSIKELQLVVTSSGILTRHVMRCLRKLVVDVKDVERDFAASFHMGGTKTNDADILVSPTVGIILSSAPEIQQQPLPGSKTMSKIRTRIVKLAHKFEKLYILVKTDGSTTFIYQGITDIINFSKQHGLACGTVIEILLCVGEEEQARQVLTIAESHSPSTDSFSLMDEVSRGELWLRKEADLNTYAAQALLELMISIFQVNREEGLTTLRRMTDEDRIQRLIPFVGEKCITRLNLALSRFQQDFLEMELRAREMYD